LKIGGGAYPPNGMSTPGMKDDKMGKNECHGGFAPFCGEGVGGKGGGVKDALEKISFIS